MLDFDYNDMFSSEYSINDSILKAIQKKIYSETDVIYNWQKQDSGSQTIGRLALLDPIENHIIKNGQLYNSDG